MRGERADGLPQGEVIFLVAAAGTTFETPAAGTTFETPAAGTTFETCIALFTENTFQFKQNTKKSCPGIFPDSLIFYKS